MDDFGCVGPGIEPDLGNLLFRNLTDYAERFGRWHVDRGHIDLARDIEDRMIGREALDLGLVPINRDDLVASAIEGAHRLIPELLGIGGRPDDGYAFHSSKYSPWGLAFSPARFHTGVVSATASYPTYRVTDRHDTTADMLTRAAQIGRAQGLRFVYAGNRPGEVGQLEHTRCPACEAPVIERHGYDIRAYRLTAAGDCGSCGASVPGRWDPMDAPRHDASRHPAAATDLDGL